MADKFSSEDIYVETGYDNIILIDPNKVNSKTNPDGEARLVQHENLVYYANLETKVVPRTKLAIGESVDSPVINTTIASLGNGDEDLNLNFLKPKGKESFDTSWSDQITGKGSREGKSLNQTSEYAVTSNGKTQFRRKVLNYEDTQMFGIKSISVTITPAGTPKVNMTLVDVQGRTLFEQGDNSIYSVFFNLPYPAFYLTIKGYYGKAVRLQLMLKSFNAKFSPDSGNFEIDIELIGRLNALLFDTVLGYARNSPKMTPIYVNKTINQGNGSTTTTQTTQYLGRQKLEEVYKQYKSKKLIAQDFDEIDLQEFINRLENYDKNALARSQKADFKIINHISDFEDNLKNLESVVFNNSKSKFLDITKPYVLKNQNNVYYFFKPTINKSDRNLRINNLKAAFKNYLEKLKLNPAFGQNAFFEIEQNDGRKINFGLKIDPFGYNENTGFNSINQVINVDTGFITDIDWIQTFRYRFSRDPVDNAELTNFENTEKSNLDISGKVWDGVSLKTVPVDLFDFGEPIDKSNVYTPNSFLDIIQKKKKILDDQKIVIEENLSSILGGLITDKNNLGFEPTIRNVFCVILAGIDAFFKLMDDVHEKAWAQRKNKKRLDLIVNNKQGPDYNRSVQLSSGVLNNESIVYPWPLYYERKTDKNNRELYEVRYPGEVVGVENNPTIWPEVQFTEQYIEASKQTFSPAPINKYNNPANQIKFATFNALEFPFKFVPYNNLGPSSFVYELFERCFLNANYTKLIRNNKIPGLAEVIGEFEAENALDEISADSTLSNLFLNQVTDYDKLISEMQSQSARLYTTYKTNLFVTPYLNTEIGIENSVYSIDTIAATSKTSTGSLETSKKIQDYLKNTSSNKTSFLDTYPFTILSWLKNNLSKGASISNVEDANQTITSFDFDTQKKIISRLSQSGPNKLSMLSSRDSYFNGSQLVLANQSSTLKYSISSRNDLKSYYSERTNYAANKAKYLYFTEMPVNYKSTYNGKVSSPKQTTSIFNTPYFYNALQVGVQKYKTASDKNPYAALGYLYVNSLPLITTRDKLKKINSDNISQTDTDYLYATLNKFSAIHQVPFSWILKYGSIWHRYKKWVDSDYTQDILDNVWTDFDYAKNYDPTNSNLSHTYNLKDQDNQDIALKLQSSSTQTINNTQIQNDSINLGFYPKLINDFHYFFTSKDLFSTYGTNDISGVCQTKKIKIAKNTESAFSLPINGDTTEPNRQISLQNFFSYIDVEGNLDFNVGAKYLLLPSAGGININQSVLESYSDTNNKNEELLNNKKMFNGSIRGAWFSSNFGYFDSSSLVKPNPDEYIKVLDEVVNDGNGTPSFGNDTNQKYMKIEEIFSLFTPELLDEFEKYFLDFCNPTATSIVLKEEDISTGTKNVEQKSLMSQLKNIYFVDKQNISFFPDQNSTGKSLLENQIKNFVSGISNFLDFECILKIGNPGNFNRLYFSDFTNDPLFVETNSKKNYGNYSTDKNLPIDVLRTVSIANSPAEWRTLHKYLGISSIGLLSIASTQSYVYNFFQDFDIKFTQDNIKNLSQLLKIYVTKKYDNPSYNPTSLKKDLVDYLKDVSGETKTSINSALSYLNAKLKNNSSNNSLPKTPNTTYGNVLKLETYTVLKNFNDKWVAGSDFKNKLLFEDFLFHDRANVDIGDDYTVDITKVLGYIKNNDSKSVMDVLSNILTDNNFVFFALPSYINFYGIQSAVIKNQTIPVEIPNSMFATYLNVDYLNSKPKFLCIYVGKQSEYLQTTDTTFSKFGDDSFDMRNQSTNPLRVPASSIDYDRSSPVVGFNVDFGILNQNIFKDVTLDMSEKKNTAETFAVNEQMGKAGAGDSVAQQSVSLYSIYKSRSYTCDVKSMGCAVIQPTMYFNLRHVPLFRGPYWISEVKHNISERGFDTSFKGIRMPLFSLPKPESFLMGVNKIFVEKWKKEILKTRVPTEVESVSKFESNISTAPNPATNGGCIDATLYKTIEFVTEERKNNSEKELFDAITANTTNGVFRAYLHGLTFTETNNTTSTNVITSSNYNIFGIVNTGDTGQLINFLDKQTCKIINGVDKPIATFTDIDKPIKYLVQKDQPAVVPIATNLYNINTAFISQNDNALSSITATTDVKVLRLACSLTQIKLILNDTDLPNNTSVSDIYDTVKQKRTNGLISDEFYLFLVSAFVRAIDIFDAESTFP